MQKENILNLLNNDKLSQPKILLIEDCQFDSVLLKNIIESHYPFTLIDHVELLADALELLKQNEYDIIFMDLHLPDTECLSNISKIRENAENTPLITVTGLFDNKTKQASKNHGADGIIDKSQLVGTSLSEAIDSATQNIVSV